MAQTELIGTFDVRSYGRIRETHAGAFSGVLKYDREYPDPDIPPAIFTKSLDILFEEFAMYESTCPLTKEDEVKMPLDTHCGYEYRLQGYRKKGEVLKSAHKVDELIQSFYTPEYPTVWKIAVKGGELLKRSKLENNDARVFMVPGLKYQYWECRLLQNQHNLLNNLGKDPKHWLKIGYAFQYGGFSYLCELLSMLKYILEGDCVKWDSAWLPWVVFNVIIPLRVYLYQVSEGMSKEEFRLRLILQYCDALFTILVMPNGQVLMKRGGMPSGKYTTGDDNSLTHKFVIILMYVINNLVQQYYLDRWYLLADDHIASLVHERLLDFDLRANVYRLLNINLSREKDKTSTSLEGHTFLGFTAHYSEVYHKWVPVYNFDKAMCSALYPGGSLSPVMRYVRVSAYRILCYFHPKGHLIKKLAMKLYNRSWKVKLSTGELQLDLSDLRDWKDSVEFLVGFPSDADIEHLWLGLESGKVAGDEKFEPLGNRLTIRQICALIN